jgi:hypothetical protein
MHNILNYSKSLMSIFRLQSKSQYSVFALNQFQTSGHIFLNSHHLGLYNIASNYARSYNTEKQSWSQTWAKQMRMAVHPRHRTFALQVITFIDTIIDYLRFQNHYLQHTKPNVKIREFSNLNVDKIIKITDVSHFRQPTNVLLFIC